jgi:hypothetical protein
MGLMQVRCCLCEHVFTNRDPQPIGEDGARFFKKPAECYVCFWCVGKWVEDPSDETEPRFPPGRA